MSIFVMGFLVAGVMLLILVLCLKHFERTGIFYPSRTVVTTPAVPTPLFLWLSGASCMSARSPKDFFLFPGDNNDGPCVCPQEFIERFKEFFAVDLSLS